MGAVVLFDGVCNFCDASVNFIINRDRAGYFKFAPLQSDVGRRLAAECGFAPKVSAESGQAARSIPIDSVVLVENGNVYTKSSAALRIIRRLDGLWPLLAVFSVVPRSVRDYFYDLFAKYRYRLFGRNDQCTVPTSALKSRFLR